MPYKNMAVQRAYQNQWIKNRRLSYLSDKACVICGATKNLEIDHIFRKEKITHRVWSFSIDKMKNELAKCQVLCRNCHRNKTNSDLGYNSGKHGTTMYRNGCRCYVCKTAHRDYARIYRKNKGANQESPAMQDL